MRQGFKSLDKSSTFAIFLVIMINVILTTPNFREYLMIFSVGETAGGGAGAAGQGQGGAAGGTADEQLSRGGGGEEGGPPAGTEGDHGLPASRSQASRQEQKDCGVSDRLYTERE
jgi:hypothetical protein